MENTLITSDRLQNLVDLCKLTGKSKRRIIAEVGVYKGGSLKTLAEAFPDDLLYGFDTFEGLPAEHWNEKEVHEPGDFNDTDIDSVFRFIDNSNVMLVKGLFPESADKGQGGVDMMFDFVHIDTDFYEGVIQSLRWFWPRMIDGGIIVFDDYGWPRCPGVKRALKEFGHPVHETENVKYQAWIIK